MNKTDDVPRAVGHKQLDSSAEELADYLSVNCPEHYEAIVEFGRTRFKQGAVHGARQRDTTWHKRQYTTSCPPKTNPKAT